MYVIIVEEYSLIVSLYYDQIFVIDTLLLWLILSYIHKTHKSKLCNHLIRVIHYIRFNYKQSIDLNRDECHKID